MKNYPPQCNDLLQIHVIFFVFVFVADDVKSDKESREERRKRRKTRWGGSEHDKTFIPGMPTVLPTNLTPEQEQAYLCKFDSLFIYFRKDIVCLREYLERKYAKYRFN